MNKHANKAISYHPLWDWAGVLASVTCLVHCLMLPVLLAAMPALLGGISHSEAFHAWLAGLLFLPALLGLLPGFLNHRRLQPVVMAGTGLALVVVAAFFAHEILSEEWEIPLTVAGSIFLVSAHLMNRSFCKACPACRDTSECQSLRTKGIRIKHIFLAAIIASLCFALIYSLPAKAASAHEHGVANLDVALDGNKLTLMLESPLDNLANFEHAPRNEKQRAALKKMEDILATAERLFKPTTTAQCKPAGVRVTHPYQPADKSSQGNKHDHKKGAEHEEGSHAELTANWEFVCDRPSELTGVEVLFLEVFKGLKQLRVQTVSSKGQGSVTLTGSKRAVKF